MKLQNFYKHPLNEHLTKPLFIQPIFRGETTGKEKKIHFLNILLKAEKFNKKSFFYITMDANKVIFLFILKIAQKLLESHVLNLVVNLVWT
jgi:hypothetical protein